MSATADEAVVLQAEPHPTQPQPEEEHSMSEKKVWFITGAGRGLGVDIAKAALAAGHAVVATARNAESVTQGAR